MQSHPANVPCQAVPFARLEVDPSPQLIREDGSATPAHFCRGTMAFDDRQGVLLDHDIPLTVATPLGTALRLHAGSKNLLAGDLSQGQSLEGVSAEGNVELLPDDGITGPGMIRWTPEKAGDMLSVTLPVTTPEEHIPGYQTGIFVALCFSAYIKSDIRLTIEMANPVDPDYPQAPPQFVDARPGEWQRGVAAIRIIGENPCTVRIVAHGSGAVYLDGLQLDPRPFPCWMIESGEPMKNGWAGPWVAGGSERGHDSLSVPLAPGDIAAAGAVSLWFQPDWPAKNYSHVLFEIASDALGLCFSESRLIGAAGGSQVWTIDGSTFLQMVRLERGRWHHAALTWEVDGQVALYLDGECYARRKSSAACRLDPAKITGPLCLGMPSDPHGFQGLPSLPSRLDGLLADFRLYHQALDEGAVAALALAGQAKLDAGLFTDAPDRFAWLEPGTPEVLAESPYFCWFPNTMAMLPDGSVETRAAYGPDFAPVITPYWKKEGVSNTVFRKQHVDAPWQIGTGTTLRKVVRLPDGRWFTMGLSRACIVSMDGKNWEEIIFTIVNAPEHAVIGTHLQKIDKWLVDSQGRLLGLGLMTLSAPGGEETMQERLFGGVGKKEQHLFLATPTKEDFTRLEIISIVTEGQPPIIGAYCEENQFIETAPGEFLLVGRVFGHNLPCFQMRSEDGGRTWSKAETCPFGAVWPVLEKLDNGIVFCHLGRPEAVIHWTTDGGRTWSPPVTLVDSREQPVQSMNAWYGSSTGYGNMLAVGPDRLFESHDVLGAYNPETMQRTNQCCATDIRVRTLENYAARVTQRVDNGQFTFTGAWRADGEGASVWTTDPKAGATLTFDGAGIALIHPLLRQGGKLLATIDGQPARTVDLYDALPHHRYGRTVVAADLPPGRHTLTLTPDLSGADRHAHGDGAELSSIMSWIYMMHATARRWAAFCAAEILHGTK